jgi:hypothetical protein
LRAGKFGKKKKEKVCLPNFNLVAEGLVAKDGEWEES